MKLLMVIIIPLIVQLANNALGMTTHSIHIEWEYESYQVPRETELAGYRLYKNGIKICQFDIPYDFEGDCEFTSNDGFF